MLWHLDEQISNHDKFKKNALRTQFTCAWKLRKWRESCCDEPTPQAGCGCCSARAGASSTWANRCLGGAPPCQRYLVQRYSLCLSRANNGTCVHYLDTRKVFLVKMIPRSNVSLVKVKHSNVRFHPFISVFSFHQDHLGSKEGRSGHQSKPKKLTFASGKSWRRIGQRWQVGWSVTASTPSLSGSSASIGTFPSRKAR